MANPNASEPSATDASGKPKVGERAEQFVSDAFRVVRLTKECGIPFGEKAVPAGMVADAVMVRTALIALSVHYNIGGSEMVEASRLAAWHLAQGTVPK